MKRKLPYASVLVLLLLPAFPGWSTAQDAVLYESVENMAVVAGERIAIASLQGTAAVGNPFCPQPMVTYLIAQGVIPANTKACSVTAFGGDDVNTATGAGTVWARIATVLNPTQDNSIDPAEAIVATGVITAQLQAVPFAYTPLTLTGKKSSIGPSAAWIILRDGRFRPDAAPALPDLSPVDVPAVTDPCEPTGGCFRFRAIFRLPFALGHAGEPVKPVRGKDAFYLADDGRLIKVQPDEKFLGFPVPRAEVTFLDK